jgi:hypothetical protein
MKLLPSDPDLQTIVGRIENGDLDLQPNFQRGEVWSVSKKQKLIDSILRDWHIPPIHVVVGDSGKQEVLDGQQRLVSIRDFVRGGFPVDGHAEPLDASIQELDGLRYDELPPEVRRAFDQFTIRVFRLVDYKPGEPGELFFRLNQMTYLTAAEQRNAFFGPVREQVRSLVEALEPTTTRDVIGFSNRRMAYDDVFARVLCTLELGTLGIKLSANQISSRYRSSNPFSKQTMRLAEGSVGYLKDAFLRQHVKIRFNKATLFSWLIFSSYFAKARAPQDALVDFIWMFEAQRVRSLETPSEFRLTQLTKLPGRVEQALVKIFSDRSSSRVSDVSSVIFRDFILWLFCLRALDEYQGVLPKEKRIIVNRVFGRLSESKEYPERVLEENVDATNWGALP